MATVIILEKRNIMVVKKKIKLERKREIFGREKSRLWMHKFQSFLKEERGVFALILALLAPLILAVIVVSFDGSKLFMKGAKLSDALREATFGASALRDKSQRKAYVLAYLRAYFNSDDTEFSNVFLTEESALVPNQKGKMEKKDMLVAYADIEFPKWFSRIIRKKSRLSAFPTLIETSENTKFQAMDYLFVMDFSQSMSTGFSVDVSGISFCNRASQDYDDSLCARLKFSANRAQAMQTVVSKILKIINKSTNYQSRFAFLPFGAGSQYKKRYYYEEENTITKTAIQKFVEVPYFVAQITLKDPYVLNASSYDFWSGVLSKRRANFLRVRDFHFDSPPYATHPDRMIAERLFNDFFDEENMDIHKNIRKSINDIVDYDKTLENMFDSNKAFSFRFYNKQTDYYEDSAPFTISNARLNGIAYDWYGTLRPYNEATKKLGFKFYEMDFRPIYNPEHLDILTEIPFDRYNLGDGGTMVSLAILRAAAMLTKGTHRKRMIILITDANDGEKAFTARTVLDFEDNLYRRGLCEKVRFGMKIRGVETQIFIINIENKSNTRQTLKEWKKCTGRKNSFIVENVNELFDALKKIMFVETNSSRKFFYRD